MWSWIRSSIGRCFMFRHRHVGSMFLHEVPPCFLKTMDIAHRLHASLRLHFGQRWWKYRLLLGLDFVLNNPLTDTYFQIRIHIVALVENNEEMFVGGHTMFRQFFWHDSKCKWPLIFWWIGGVTRSRTNRGSETCVKIFVYIPWQF